MILINEIFLVFQWPFLVTARLTAVWGCNGRNIHRLCSSIGMDGNPESVIHNVVCSLIGDYECQQERTN